MNLIREDEGVVKAEFDSQLTVGVLRELLAGLEEFKLSDDCRLYYYSRGHSASQGGIGFEFYEEE